MENGSFTILNNSLNELYYMLVIEDYDTVEIAKQKIKRKKQVDKIALRLDILQDKYNEIMNNLTVKNETTNIKNETKNIKNETKTIKKTPNVKNKTPNVKNKTNNPLNTRKRILIK